MSASHEKEAAVRGGGLSGEYVAQMSSPLFFANRKNRTKSPEWAVLRTIRWGCSRRLPNEYTNFALRMSEGHAGSAQVGINPFGHR